MDKTLIIVCAVVGSLGVLSAIFGFSAEGTKLTPYNILVFFDECIYPPNPAFGLGISAAIFLLAAQVASTAVGGCCGCCNKSRSNPSETKRIVGIVCAVVSWIAAGIAWVLLIVGVAWNVNEVRMDAPYCPYLKDGIFAGAGVLTLAATALGVTSYVLMRTKRVESAAAPPVVPPAKGKPKLPPASTQGNNGSPRKPEVQSPPADDTVAVPPATVASAPPEPAGDPTPQAGAEMGQQPPVQLPQAVGVPNENETIQYPGQQQQGSSEDLIRKEMIKAGIRLGARVVEHSLFSDGGVGDILVSMTDLQSTDAV